MRGVSRIVRMRTGPPVRCAKLLSVICALALASVKVGAGRVRGPGMEYAIGPYSVQPVAPENATDAGNFVYAGMTNDDQTPSIEESMMPGNYSEQIAAMKVAEDDIEKTLEASDSKYETISQKENALNKYVMDEMDSIDAAVKTMNREYTDDINDPIHEVPGPPGLPGLNGHAGDEGVEGPTGPDGAKGVAGPLGRPGPEGEVGSAGEKGQDGKSGPPGTRGKPGGTGDKGKEGGEGEEGEVLEWMNEGYDCPESSTETMRLRDCSWRGCRLEVRFENTWGTVCSYGWRKDNAATLCRALGFSGGGKKSRAKGGGGKVWLQDVSCKGGEGDVGDCEHSGWGETSCGHADDVGLCCWPSRTNAAKRQRVGPSYFSRCPEFHTKDMRLVDCNRFVCRLEVKHRSQWGTVCDSGFTDTNANFVCKMMGFEQGKFKQACGSVGEFASCATNVGGAGHVWLDDVFCYGFEQSIDGCRHKPWGQNRCGHKQDVGVCCSGGDAEDLQQAILDAGSNMAGLNALNAAIEKIAGFVAAEKSFQDAVMGLGGAAAGKVFDEEGGKKLEQDIVNLSQLHSFQQSSFLAAIEASSDSKGLAALQKALIATVEAVDTKSTVALIQHCAQTIFIAMSTASGLGSDAFKAFYKAVEKVSAAALAVKQIQLAVVDGSEDALDSAAKAAGVSLQSLQVIQQAILNAGGAKAAAVALQAMLAEEAKKAAQYALSGPPGSCPEGELSYDLKKGASGLESSTGGNDLGVVFGGAFAGADGFKFMSGQGLGVDPFGCIPSDQYTIYMRVKLQQTLGVRFLVHSGGWVKDGLVVDNNLMLAPAESEFKCDETIIPNRWYQFVLTRATDAKLTLYVHGGRCSEGISEMGHDWLSLNKHSVQFFLHGLKDTADGSVSNIRIFNHSLSEEEVAEICSCTLPDKGAECKYTLVMNTVPAGTKYSSIGSLPVSNGRLGSKTGWIAGSNDVGEWMQFDTGFVQSILGVVTQGRRDQEAWVTTFKVAVSKDSKTWDWIGCGRVFDGNIDRNTRLENLFFEPVLARYVRIYPETWKNGIGLRAGAVVCELPCWESSYGAELDYKFQLSFLSSTMGPDLSPTWGEGEFLPVPSPPNSGFYYKFEKGQGLSLNQERCINTTSWTIFIHFALDETSGGYKRVLSSGRWGDYGLYVNKYLMLVPKGARMRCFERIRTNKYYKIYFTRDEDGNLALYINGAECASGDPPYKDHYQLSPVDVTFFKDDSGEDAGGSLKEIKMWDKALNESEIELHSGCKRPQPGKRCKFKVIYNSPVSRTTYSSIRSGSPGKGLGRGRLNSKQAWCAASNDKSQYMEIDIGFLQNITGFVTQGRRDADEWVTSYTVQASVDGSTWTDVGCGTQFEGSTDRSTKVKSLLHRPIIAQYLRIYPQTWNGGLCMRFGMILCEKPCVEGRMDYDFDGSMMSVTGGPSLDPAWGDGYFDVDGYHFEGGLGMEVETQRCLMNNTITTAYTVMIEMVLDNPDHPQMILSSDGWDQGGLVVDGWLQLAPSGTNMVCEDQHFKRGKTYKITMTRTAQGKITLYLNGAECASGDPPFFSYYRLKKERVVFFHDDNEKNMDPKGVVRRIVMLKRVSAKLVRVFWFRLARTHMP